MSLSVRDVTCCNFPNWYSKFNKCTITSEVLPLPDDVLRYLRDTGTLVLPSSCRHQSTNTHHSDNDEDWPHTDAAAAAATSSAEAAGVAVFSLAMRSAINKLGGAVFPKLNSTAPQDAAWMSYTKTLRCCTPADVYLLLKSSNLITRDLMNPQQGCSDEGSCPPCPPCLVLRGWREINPSTEFRGFVRDGHFMGLCPRDVSQYFAYIGPDRTNIIADITSFWRENIDNRLTIRSYAFDVARDGKDSVCLLDVAPLHPSRTKSLLFDWQELIHPPVTVMSPSEDVELEICDNLQQLNMHNSTDSNRVSEEISETAPPGDGQSDDGLPELRYISQETGVQPSHNSGYGLPVDFLDLCSGQDPYKMMDLLKLKVQSQEDEFSSSEDETS